ncbi:MAG: hypothetical protein EU981_02890 [Candidatus Liberibacter ctenarytainae]|uniref:Transmembrane protein n=1 Tax=Candidatus Liberibacter ctenarytainae TaxID=2020335 RepID=A0A937ACJ9_9HYPH|nr:hypothetical protein [Candidatus Liberibacter ctenarytainae]
MEIENINPCLPFTGLIHNFKGICLSAYRCHFGISNWHIRCGVYGGQCISYGLKFSGMEKDFRFTFGALIAVALGAATMMVKSFY